MSGGKNEIGVQTVQGVLAALRSQLEGTYCFQKFVKPRGMHAAVYRTTWRRAGSSTTVLVSCMKSMKISPSHSQANNYWCTNSTELDSNTVLSFKGKAATETQRICANIVDYVENRTAQRCSLPPLPPLSLSRAHARARSFSLSLFLSVSLL